MRSILAVVLMGFVAGCPKTAPVPQIPVAAAFPDRPVPGAPSLFNPAVPTKTMLSNGVPVYTVTDSSLPLVSVRLVVPTGAVNDPAGQYGLASLGTSMLGESAAGRTALEQAAAVEAQAASVSFGVGRETLQMSVDSHAKRIDKVLPLAADALLRPTFAADDYKRVHEQHITGLKAALDSNRAVSALVSQREWWGPTHPYGTPADGTVASAGGLGLAKIKSWHAAQVNATGAAFVVVGDVTSARATEMLEANFGAWKGGKRVAIKVPPAAAKSGLLIVDRPGSTQTVVNVVLPGQSDAAPDRAPLDVVQTIMGGSFTSRLNRRLREELGYTYGARTSVSRMASAGTIQSGAAVRADATASALSELMGMLKTAAADGMTPEELARGRAQVITRTVDGVETRGGLAGTYAGEIAAGRAPEQIGTWISSLDSLDAAAIKKASAMLGPDQALMVLVGDLSAIEGALKEEGFTEWSVVTVDAKKP